MIDMTWLVGGRWEKSATIISSIKITGGQPPGPVDLVISYFGGDSKIFDRKGGMIEAYPAAKDQAIQLSLVPSGASWGVSDFTTVGVEG